MGVFSQPEVVCDYTRLPKQICGVIDQLKAKTEILPDRTRLQYSVSESDGLGSRVSPVEAGYRRVKRIFWVLDRMGFIWSPTQRELLRDYVYACLPQIFGIEVFESNELEILEHYNLDKIRYEVLAIAPRRFGKSWSIGAILAAFLHQIPELIESTFSSGARASIALKKIMVKMFKRIPGVNEHFIVRASGQEEFSISPVGNPNDLRQAYFYPSSKRLKGVTAHIVVLEEAALLDLGVFYEVVLPLMGVKGTALLAISTPRGERNFYSDLFTMKDENGEPFFNIKHILLICERCRRDPDMAKQENCVHNRHLLPHWKTEERQERLHKMMEKYPDLYRQEVLADIIKDNGAVFPTEYIDRWKARETYKTVDDFKAKHLYVAIDPTGGGASRFAMSSGFFGPDGQLVVCGLERERFKGIEVQEQLVASAIQRMQEEIPEVQDSKICSIIEANLDAVNASAIARSIDMACEAVHMKHNDRNAPGKIGYGVFTTADKKFLCAQATLGILRHNAIQFHEKLVTVGSKLKNGTGTVKANKHELFTELANYTKLSQESKNPLGKDKSGFTGKIQGLQDDLVQSLQMLVYYPTEFVTSPFYAAEAA